MNKKDMVTRLIWQGEVYYRLKDVAELREVTVARLKRAIEKQNIPTTVIEGFGRMKWIEERYVNEIEIDEEIVYMRTEFKDYQRELDLKGTASALACAFLNKEFDTSKVVKETLDSMDNFATETTNERAKENKEKIKVMNELFEQEGVANKFYSFEFLVGNEINEMTVLINAEGRIVDSESFLVDCTTDNETLGYFREEIREYGGVYDTCQNLIQLDFGVPFECENMSVHLMNELLRNLSENEIKMFSNDWIDVELDNGGNYLGIKLDTFLDMLNEDIRVVA